MNYGQSKQPNHNDASLLFIELQFLPCKKTSSPNNYTKKSSLIKLNVIQINK